MRFISTRMHGVADYLVGVLLIFAPWIFNFALGGAETWVPVLLGAAVLIYSMFTQYELGLFRIIPMSTHLLFDFLGGALLAASPWLFGFSDVVTTPHVVVGLFEILASLTTQTRPSWQRAGVYHEQ